MFQPMQISVSVGIIGRTGGTHEGAIRLARFSDIERLFGDGWAVRSPALVAAALALIEKVPRVVVAPTLEALPSDILLAAVIDPLPRAARDALRAREGGLVLADVGDDVPPGEVLAGRRRGVRFVIGMGNFLVPGQRQAAAVGGAAMALPLVFGRPMLGPLVDFIEQPVALDMRGVGALALETYRPKRSAPRVVLPVTERPAPEDEPDETPSEPNARLEAALRELAERFTHRLGRDKGAVATLEREAHRLLQYELQSGAITSYALAVEPVGDDIAIEVAVGVPKRVGKVIIKLVQTP